MSEEPMDTHMAYCSACDREVAVAFAPGREPKPGGTVDPSTVICLDYGEQCTGSMCPLFAVPTDEMRGKLERAGLRRPKNGEGRS